MNDRVLLSLLLASKQEEEPPLELKVPFAAVYGHTPKIVTAVLQRTAVLAEPSDRYERVSVRHDLVLVDPAMVEWRPKTSTYEGARLNGEAKKRLKISASPWRVEMATTYSAVQGNRATQREASDERALKNRAQIKETEEKEMQFLRRRTAEQAAETKEESVNAIGTPMHVVPADTYSGSPMRVPADAQGTKRCRRCGDNKPRAEFAATGIYGGYCATCEPIEKAERAAARENGTRPKAKGGRRAKPKSEKPVHKVDAEVTSNGYDHVVKLLHRRDSLKLELAKVNEQLQEALA